MNVTVIDSHMHCGIQNVSLPWEEVRDRLHEGGIQGACLFAPVEDIYDRYDYHFQDTAAWAACRFLPVVQFMASGPGWILAMIGLNMVPGMALKAARQSPRNAAMLLAGHGAFAGVCLSPLIFLAMLVSGVGTDAPNLVQSALVITAAVFLGISGYIYQSGASFNYGKGFGVGLAWTLFAGIGMSYLFPMSSGFGLFILLGVGVLGTLQLLWATSSVLRDPDFRDPAYGALMLFAGLFNLFQVILSLLIRSRR